MRASVRRLRGLMTAVTITAASFMTAPEVFAADTRVADKAPRHDLAPLHYVGVVDFDPEAGRLGAGWTIAIRDRSLDRIAFSLSATLGLAAVSGPDLASVRTELDPRSDGTIRTYHLVLSPARPGQDRYVKFAYSGRLLPPDTNLLINTLDPDKIELTVDSFWFPFDARFDTDLTASVHARLNGDWRAIGVEGVRRVPTGFIVEQTRPGLDIAFSLLSRSLVVDAQGFVIHDVRREPGTRLGALKSVLDDCTHYLNALAGPAGPLPQASILVTGRADGAYSRGTLIALTDIEDAQRETLLQFICHELAHYWSHANAGGPENWINEGVADHLANMAVREVLGEAVFAARMARYADHLDGRDMMPIWTPETKKRPDYAVMYRAAPLALWQLEARMGREAFESFMRAMMVEEIATTPELLALLTRLAGVETAAWFKARLGQ